MVPEAQMSQAGERRHNCGRHGECQTGTEADGAKGDENGECDFPHRVHGMLLLVGVAARHDV